MAIVVIAYGVSFFEFTVPWLNGRSTLMDNGWLEFLAFLVWMSLPWYLIQSARNRAMENPSKDIRELNTPKPIDNIRVLVFPARGNSPVGKSAPAQGMHDCTGMG